MGDGGKIVKIKKNLSSYLLPYSLLSMGAGVALGHTYDLRFLSKYMIYIVFAMVYPMMTNLSPSDLRRIGEIRKPVIEAMALNFIVSPALMWILASAFIPDPKVKLALMLLSVAPASSMGLGYVGLAEGHMLTASVIVATAFILSVLAYPVFGHYLAMGANIPVPLSLMLKNVALVLVLPLILGIATREVIERRYGPGGFKRAKPYFATVTLTFLYVIIFSIFASKANLIVKNYAYILLMLPLAVLFYGISLLLILFVNKRLLNLEYGHHQAVAFTTVSKNVALTIAILVTVFGKEGQYMAAFPAIMSLFQVVFLVTYLRFSDRVRELLGRGEVGGS